MLAILLPTINPVMINFGPLSIRWYGLAYILGTLFGLIYSYYLENDLKIFKDTSLKKKFYEDIVVFIVLGILIGGRLGYVLIYNFSYYINDPKKIFYVWEGGMSFHGAIIGCIASLYLFSKKININIFSIFDLLAPAIPIGLFLGRIANFINQELTGRPTSMPWGVIYNGDNISRHPSELYEAFFEGILLFFILLYMWKKKKIYKKRGQITALFIIFYAIFRIFVECFRMPDAQIGFIFKYFTMGQILSFIMFIIGLIMFYYVSKVNNDKSKDKKNN